MITTTLNRIEAHTPNWHSPYYTEPAWYTLSWSRLLNGLGKTSADDELLPFAHIVEICGLSYALNYCEVEPQYEVLWWTFALRCVRRIQHLMTDRRSIAALDTVERYVAGTAKAKDLIAARQFAHDAYERVDGVRWAAESLTYSFAWRSAVQASARCEVWDAENAAWEAGESSPAVEYLEACVTSAHTKIFLNLVSGD